MHVAIVDEWLPFPIENGKKSRSYNLIVPLANRYRITYIAPHGTDPLNDQVAEEELRKHGIDVHWVARTIPDNSGLLFGPRLAANLLSPLPYSVQRHISPKMQQAVAKLESSSQVDLWHAEWTPYVYNLRNNVSTPWIVNAHNIESQIWYRSAEAEHNIAKAWYLRNQWRKCRSFERKAFHEARCVVTTTACDAEIAVREFDASNVEVVSNGVDLARFQSDRSERDRFELLFLGSLSWRPNLEAVDQLLKRIFPAILAAEPRAKLTIVGYAPPIWLRLSVANTARVTLHGDVPDVMPYLKRAGALLVPLSIGGGSRIKILEALATGCPVISTDIGAEGLDLSPGRDYVRVEHLDAFADQTTAAIHDYPYLLRTAESGNRVVREHYGWDKLSHKLGDIWELQFKGRRACV